MVCKHCETENPQGAVFCTSCGKRLDGKKNCPSCDALCPEEAAFCMNCGNRLIKTEQNEAPAFKAQEGCETFKSPAPKKNAKGFEQVKRAFDLSGGICLMVAVLFALVFTLCLGFTSNLETDASVSTTASETKMIWYYLGDVYKDVRAGFEAMDELDLYYSEYFVASNYIPVVLFTIICATTLTCVIIFTTIAAIRYGKHFKNPALRYLKPAVAAIFSFLLGASLLFAIPAVAEQNGSTIIRFSRATMAGIVLCGVLLGAYLICKTVTIGKDFAQKQTIISFVCPLVGIALSILVAVFATSPALKLVVKDASFGKLNVEVNFFGFNTLISGLYTTDFDLNDTFQSAYVCSLLAQFAQVALIVAAFLSMIKHVESLGNRSKSCLATDIPMLVFAVCYLIFVCIAIALGNDLMTENKKIVATLSMTAASIVALIASAFALANTITYKILSNNADSPQTPLEQDSFMRLE